MERLVAFAFHATDIIDGHTATLVAPFVENVSDDIGDLFVGELWLSRHRAVEVFPIDGDRTGEALGDHTDRTILV